MQVYLKSASRWLRNVSHSLMTHSECMSHYKRVFLFIYSFFFCWNKWSVTRWDVRASLWIKWLFHTDVSALPFSVTRRDVSKRCSLYTAAVAAAAARVHVVRVSGRLHKKKTKWELSSSYDDGIIKLLLLSAHRVQPFRTRTHYSAVTGFEVRPGSSNNGPTNSYWVKVSLCTQWAQTLSTLTSHTNSY